MQNETNKELLKAAQTLSNKLTALQEEWVIHRYGCNSLKTKGVFDCNHCFKFAIVDHISRHFRKSQNHGN